MKEKRGSSTKTGLLGMICINIATTPQIIKTICTRNVEGISVYFYLILFVGLCFYLKYALSRRDLVYIASNIISLCQTTIMISLIFAFGGG